ncbi:MAG TPA: transglycosylase domain-containing protein [Solirubrobacteraceae bacterium]|nr:transglycosylase domain-containing protein [Solirubrobacteraceae bacterium]
MISAIVVAAVLLIGGTAYVAAVAATAPPLSSLKAKLGGGSSELFAANGAPLGFVNSSILRTPIAGSEMPADLRNATVSIEDQRFYQDQGVDYLGLLRAALKDITSGRTLQGGSTITMQLMRNLYLGGDDHSVRQKIIEAKLALEYEKRHSKSAILTSYLNSVPYGTVGGQTAVGVQAAAQIFFGKTPKKLDLQQAALLAGLPQAPSEYNPFLNPKAARERRNEVLAKMAELGYVSSSRAQAAERAPLEVHHGDLYTRRREDFFFEYVRGLLEKRYGAATVDTGGLKVYTTLNLRLQKDAREAIAKVLYEPGDPASAIVTINPANGDIEAMAESESFKQSQFNLAADGHRQPGSTFKGIDLADALSKGIDPYSTYYYSHTLQKGWLPAYPEYEVRTFEGTSLDRSISLLQATLTSDNTVYAQLAADMGEESVTQTAYAMGVKVHLKSYAAEALGGLEYGVTPLEMADVYATLADGGWRNEPIAITKVVFPDGRVDANWGTPHRTKVLTDGVTSVETEILHDNVLGGTAVRSAIRCYTAAKTGTTTELVDAWLDGYMPNYATSVWMGYPNSRVPMTDVQGEPQQGGALPAEIWKTYMEAVVEGQECEQFPQPTEPIEYHPFYGKYELQDSQLRSRQRSEELASRAPAKHPPAAKHAPAPAPAKAPAPSPNAPTGGVTPTG